MAGEGRRTNALRKQPAASRACRRSARRISWEWIERVREGSDALVAQAIAEATAGPESTAVCRTAAERALVWLPQAHLRKRTSLRGRAARSARGISAGADRARAGPGCRSVPLVDPAIAEATADRTRTASLPEPPRNTSSSGQRSNTSRKQRAASRVCRPKRLVQFPRVRGDAGAKASIGSATEKPRFRVPPVLSHIISFCGVAGSRQSWPFSIERVGVIRDGNSKKRPRWRRFGGIIPETGFPK